MSNTEGLQEKYIITKANGEAINPKAKFFVLRYDDEQSDEVFKNASKQALTVFADEIYGALPNLANDLIEAIKPQGK